MTNRDLIGQVEYDDIVGKIKKNWNNFKNQHPKLFISSSSI